MTDVFKTGCVVCSCGFQVLSIQAGAKLSHLLYIVCIQNTAAGYKHNSSMCFFFRHVTCVRCECRCAVYSWLHIFQAFHSYSHTVHRSQIKQNSKVHKVSKYASATLRLHQDLHGFLDVIATAVRCQFAGDAALNQSVFVHST